MSGRNKHPTQKCHAKYHADGTLLHIKGRRESNDEVSSGHLQLQHILTDSDMTNIMLLNNTDRMTLKSSSRGGLPRSWILLDSQSTIDVFCNRKLLTGIHSVETNLHIRCNAGVKTTNMRGYLSGYGNVWYFPDGIANILSLSQVKEKFRVTYDSLADNAFHVHKPDKILIFKEATRRLNYYDTADKNKESTVLIQTV